MSDEAQEDMRQLSILAPEGYEVWEDSGRSGAEGSVLFKAYGWAVREPDGEIHWVDSERAALVRAYILKLGEDMDPAQGFAVRPDGDTNSWAIVTPNGDVARLEGLIHVWPSKSEALAWTHVLARKLSSKGAVELAEKMRRQTPPEGPVLEGIPDAALQGYGGQRLEPADEEAAQEATPLVEAMEDVFARWFDRFNNDDPTGKAVPHDGTVSWKQAHEGIARALSDFPGLPISTRSALQHCRCVTRHMHAQPVQLPPDWVDGALFELDFENFRARSKGDPDDIGNYFAVEVDEKDLTEQLQKALDQHHAPALVEAQALDPEWARGYELGHSDARQAHARQLTADYVYPNPTPGPAIGTRGEAVPEHLEAFGYRSHTLPERNPRDEVLVPEGYRLLWTPDGFRVAWYGPPRTTEAEAVADAWRRDRR